MIESMVNYLCDYIMQFCEEFYTRNREQELITKDITILGNQFLSEEKL